MSSALTDSTTVSEFFFFAVALRSEARKPVTTICLWLIGGLRVRGGILRLRGGMRLGRWLSAAWLRRGGRGRSCSARAGVAEHHGKRHGLAAATAANAKTC